MLYYCKQCGNEKTHHVEEINKIFCLRCSECGSAIKWLSKKEVNIMRGIRNTTQDVLGKSYLKPEYAFRELCYSLHMDFVLDEDTKFIVKKNEDGENHLYILEDGVERYFDDRGDLFVALRNVAVNMFPNVYFRGDDYIYGN